MIREANFFDMAKVIQIGRELYDAAVNHNAMYQWNDEKAIAVCKHFINSDDAIVLIDEKDGNVTGFFIGQLITPLVGNEVIAIDVMLFVRPEYQGLRIAVNLIKKYELWAKKNGAKYIQLSVSSGLKQQRTTSIYTRLGYKYQSAAYFKC